MKVTLLDSIKDKCHEFTLDFTEECPEDSCVKLTYDGKWKETDEALMGVAKNILDVLANVWRNLAFGPELMKTQSEGTYVMDIIISLIWALFKELPFRQFVFISTTASANRKGKGHLGKQPDFMYLQKQEGCKPEKDQFDSGG
ncbi:25746_t:CDS:2, partial [Racocetra persica]